MDDLELLHKTKELIAYLRSSEPKERLWVMDFIEDAYCPHCGSEHPNEWGCQCWNDE